jgi:hypothetical protein
MASGAPSVDQDRETVAALTDVNGQFLTVIALLFTIKASLFSLIYFENEALINNANLKSVCLGQFNYGKLETYYDFLFVPLFLIDISIFLLPLFLGIAIAAPVWRSFTLFPSSILDRTSFYKGSATFLVSVVMLVFAFGNSGATGYLEGGVRASLDTAPTFEKILKDEQKDEICSRLTSASP